jgi:uncharacterized protein (DUF362 family)
MIGAPMPNPRDSIIADLSRKLEHYFGAGKSVQIIPRGVSANAPALGTTTHSNKLRAARDKDAPRVQAMAEAGKTVTEAAKATGILPKRIRLIASENNFKFAESS